MVREILIWSIIAPAVVTFAVLALAWKAWRRGDGGGDSAREDDDANADPASWALPLALVAAFAIGYLGLNRNESWSFPPHDAKQWIAYFAPFVLIMTWLGWVVLRRWRWAPAPAALALFATYFPLLLRRPYLTNTWAGVEAWLWLGGLIIGAGAYAVSLDRLASKLPAKSFLFPVGLYLAFSAATFAILGSVTTARHAAMPAVALGVIFLLLIWKRNRRSIRALALPIAFLQLAHGAEIYFYAYSEKPFWPLALLAIAPSMMWLVFIPPLRRALEWRLITRAIVILALVLAPTVAGGAIAYYHNVLAAPADEYDPYAEY